LKKSELERKVIELEKYIEYQKGVIQELRAAIATTPPVIIPETQYIRPTDLPFYPQTYVQPDCVYP
jgi:hypothetical protein